MELPATSPSTSRNRPALSHRNPRSTDLLLCGGVGLGCVSNHVRARVLISEKHDLRVPVSVSIRCTDRRGQEAVDLCHRKEKDWLHFVGVGGCGLSALAMFALKQGYEVSGSDIGWNSFMDGLQEAGALLYVGHSVTNMQKHNGLILPKAIVVSSAIPQDNVEILYAKSVGVPIYKRDYWLAKLTEHYNLIAVSGTHGKSTTASMLAYVLQATGDDVTAVVGAHVPQFDGGNIICGSGQNFVLEADEYDGCFLGLLPYIMVVTNVELEHVDIFEDEEAVIAIFRRFLKQIRAGGHLILCGDSVGARSLLGDKKQVTGSDYYNPAKSSLEPSSDGYRVTTYGISSSNEWHASSLCSNLQGGTDYKLGLSSGGHQPTDTRIQILKDCFLQCHRGCPVADISLQIPGVHNVLNSLAVIATVSALFGDHRHIHESVDLVRLHLNNFKGISRRFEMIGSVRGCHIFDDYAHHPTEVRAVIQAARQRFPQKDLLVVFQPHTYSRLAALKNEFATALSDADLVVVTEIYGSRETNHWNISGWHLSTSITGPPSEYIPSLEDVVDKLSLYICKDPDRETLILTLGAGDITVVGRKLLHELQQILPRANS